MNNGFIPFPLFRDLKNTKIRPCYIFPASGRRLNRRLWPAVREVVGATPSLRSEREKATRSVDTIDSKKEVNAFSIGLQGSFGPDRSVTLAWAVWAS